MRAVFFGTPGWAVPSLEALIASDVEVDAVVTNPDKPAGRGLELHATPVKEAAERHGLEVLQPQKARDEGFVEWLAARAPDVAVVVAYGKILPKNLLDVPPLGFVNVHFSLLPAYRGAAPVQRAIMNGDDKTGISIMVLTEGMDEGPVLARAEVPIEASDTSGSLGAKLATVGAPLLVDSLQRFGRSELVPQPQDDSVATYAAKITNEEAFIDWSWGARRIHDHVRALDPSPGAATMLGDKLLKIWAVEPDPSADSLEPGRVAVVSGDIVAGTGDDAVIVGELQPAGKRRMSGAEFARGLRLTGAELLGGPR
ncbi:MAG: methionyl-tRNA formyltransferase [Actinomycetota bacterium]